MKRIEHWIILLSIPALVHALPAIGTSRCSSTSPHCRRKPDKDHKDWIEVLSYSLGVANPASPGGGSSGHASFSDVTFSKLVDSSSLSCSRLLRPDSISPTPCWIWSSRAARATSRT